MGAPRPTPGALRPTLGLGGWPTPPWRTMEPFVGVLGEDRGHPWVLVGIVGCPKATPGTHGCSLTTHGCPTANVGSWGLANAPLEDHDRPRGNHRVPPPPRWRRLLLASPPSVSGDYGKYQCWDSLQALCSTVTGTLSTRAVLQTVGVGDSAATATGATLTWVLRDGVGMVTRIVFAWLQGPSLDCEAKQWRLAADVINDAGLLLELLAPGCGGAGPLLLGVAAVARV
ncbi:RUS1 family protein C16orf58-like protein [Aix galericulata]|nr:RUS1 family protein C16orf58-like protein [Aix galericulata]